METPYWWSEESRMFEKHASRLSEIVWETLQSLIEIKGDFMNGKIGGENIS